VPFYLGCVQSPSRADANSKVLSLVPWVRGLNLGLEFSFPCRSTTTRIRRPFHAAVRRGEALPDVPADRQ